MEFVIIIPKSLQLNWREKEENAFLTNRFIRKGACPSPATKTRNRAVLIGQDFPRRQTLRHPQRLYDVIAPTGSISMIAGCSSGIEPVYSLVFEKNVSVDSFLR